MIWKSRKGNRKEFGYITHKVVKNAHEIAEKDKSDRSIIVHRQTNNSIILSYTINYN